LFVLIAKLVVIIVIPRVIVRRLLVAGGKGKIAQKPDVATVTKTPPKQTSLYIAANDQRISSTSKLYALMSHIGKGKDKWIYNRFYCRLTLKEVWITRFDLQITPYTSPTS